MYLLLGNVISFGIEKKTPLHMQFDIGQPKHGKENNYHINVLFL